MVKHAAERSSSRNPGIPSGVKVIAIFEYVCAAFWLLCAIVLFFGSLYFSVQRNTITDIAPQYSSFGGGILILVGIGCLILAVISFYIGCGLWKGRNWARIYEIVFSVLGVLSGLYLILSGKTWGLVELVIQGIIGGYLLFNKDVKSAFKQNSKERRK